MGKPERYVVDAFDADEDGDFVGYQSYLELQEQAEKLAEALNLLERQCYGMNNQWAGCHLKCKTCGVLYAISGNWGQPESSDSVCPYCNALTAYQDWKKKNA